MVGRGLLLAALLLAGCAPTPVVVPTATVAPSTAAPSESAATPNLTPTPTGSRPAPSPTPTATATTGVTANALGALSGNWIFFAQRVPQTGNFNATLEVWGIAPGGQQRLAFSYTVSLGGVPEAPLDNNPYLRRQFSPDGRQVVVSTRSGLVVVDLPTGQTRGLGVSGVFPSWSKDGKTIAFLDTTVAHRDPQRGVQDEAIWIVPSAGGAARELITVDDSRTSPEWSGDSTYLMVQLADGVGRVNPVTGSEVPGGRIPFALTTTGAHSPAGSKNMIVTLIRRDDTQIVLYDDQAKVTGFLQQFPRPFDPSPCRCPMGLVPRDPRFNPSGNGEVLFVLLDEKANTTAADVLDMTSGRLSTVVANVYQATWSADGSQIVYIARIAGDIGGAVRVFDRRTGTDRELIAAPGTGTHRPSVVSVAY